MYKPYLGEIALFAFNKIPRDWMSCNGQRLRINDYPGLYSLLGGAFPSDHRETFALPNLNGKVIMGSGTDVSGVNYKLGQEGQLVKLSRNDASNSHHTEIKPNSGLPYLALTYCICVSGKFPPRA